MNRCPKIRQKKGKIWSLKLIPPQHKRQRSFEVPSIRGHKTAAWESLAKLGGRIKTPPGAVEVEADGRSAEDQRPQDNVEKVLRPSTEGVIHSLSSAIW